VRVVSGNIAGSVRKVSASRRRRARANALDSVALYQLGAVDDVLGNLVESVSCCSKPVSLVRATDEPRELTRMEIPVGVWRPIV